MLLETLQSLSDWPERAVGQHPLVCMVPAACVHAAPAGPATHHSPTDPLPCTHRPAVESLLPRALELVRTQLAAGEVGPSTEASANPFVAIRPELHSCVVLPRFASARTLRRAQVLGACPPPSAPCLAPFPPVARLLRPLPCPVLPFHAAASTLPTLAYATSTGPPLAHHLSGLGCRPLCNASSLRQRRPPLRRVSTVLRMRRAPR